VGVTSDLGKVEELVQSKKLLVFDFDGVLADSVEVKTDAFSALYEPYGSEVAAEVVNHHRNNGGMSRFEKFKHYHKEFLNKNIDENKIASLSEEFSSLVVEKVISTKEILGAGEFLKRFCTKEKLCTVNSATPLNEIKAIVKARGLSHFFQGVYGSPNSKQDNLVEIRNAFDVDMKAGVFFGDAQSDFNAAKAMGMDFIGVGKKIIDILENENGEWLVVNDFNGLINGA